MNAIFISSDKRKRKFMISEVIKSECGYLLRDILEFDNFSRFYDSRKKINFAMYTILIFQGIMRDFVEIRNTFLFTRSYCIDDLHEYELILHRITQDVNTFFKHTNDKAKTIVVLDLDETLIDENYLAICDLDLIFETLRKYYDYLFLWTHGVRSHLKKALELNPTIMKVDGTFCRQDFIDSHYPKGIGAILNYFNNKYGVTRFTKTCLVDDSQDNYQQDFTLFVKIPFKKIKNLTQYILRSVIIDTSVDERKIIEPNIEQDF